MWKNMLFAFVVGLWLTAVLHAEPTKKVTPAKKSPSVATAVQSLSLPTPLPAAQFQGRVRDAYQAAADIPEVLAGLACYCGCDKSQGHRYLLDCFVDTHGSTCGHCVNEALDAHALFMTGTPPDEIRTFIDHKYGQ